MTTVSGDLMTEEQVEARGLRLQPANAEMAPLRFPAQAEQRIGVVTAVLRATDKFSAQP
ncbi:MAG: hypothetical protein VBE63_06725 [Lamprobacter sp.]|uniref:hypothetical protein n=1 Tax=Lamprobacter sp. TaxID=3100796 RepID=UPI002B2595AA|nr:hypothetical protein [Lamprobacter sp.]MEA3639622.1 hypothetical protein [Lamprobacter sp.]